MGPTGVLAQGFSATTYDTSDGYVLRVAHDDAARQRHLCEAALLALIKEPLGEYELPLPAEPLPPSARFPYGALRYPMLRGDHPDSMVDPTSIADFLTTLHATPLSLVRSAVGTYEGWLAQQIRTAAEGTAAVRESIDRDTASWLGSFVDDLPELLANTNQRALIHGDFWSENLLVRRGRLVAVLDWEAAAIGDVAADLPGLWYLGPSPPRQVAALLGWSAETVQRAQYFRVVRELSGAVWSCHHDDAQELLESAAKVIAVVRDVRASTLPSRPK